MKTIVTVAISAAAGLAVGSFITYVVTERALHKSFSTLLDEEMERYKAYYENRDLLAETIAEDETQEDIAELTTAEIYERANAQLIKELNYSSDEPTVFDEIPESETPTTEVRPEHEARKMTVEEETPIDYESEEFQELVAARTSEKPYLITIDEYMKDGSYDRLSFTYFEGDDVLVDEREKPVFEIDATIGEDHLTMFGKFSKDKNIVYVRNERIETDFEIIRDEQSFGEVVAGFKSHNPRMKMREGD